MDKVKLKELVDIYLGVTHTPEYVLFGVPFLSVKDISNGAISFDNCKYISEAEYNSLSEGAKPKVGDMLFCRVGTLGKPIIIPEGTPLFGSFVSLGYLRNKNPEKCNMNYLRYWMNSSAFWHQVQANVKGASQVNLNTGWLSKFDVVLPDIEEQAYRITILDECSKIINKRNDQLKSLDELIKARFVEMFGDIANNSLNLKEVTVADCCKMTQGTQIPMADQISEYQEGYNRYLYIRDLKYDNDDWIYVRDQYDEKKLTERDIVVVNTGNTAGEIYRGKDGILSNNLFKVSFDSELLLPTYLFYYFRSEAFQKMLWSEMKEGTQPHLGHKIFGSKKLLIPHIYAQEQFEGFVKQVDKSKAVIQKSLDETQLLFDSLMQDYFG